MLLKKNPQSTLIFTPTNSFFFFQLRDLFGFLYVALICIVAYGVASRAMIKRSHVTFTAQSIFENIFYVPYWFLYGDADDEKRTLDSQLFHII